MLGTPDNAPSEIALILPLNTEYNLNEALKLRFPAVQVKASNKGGTVEDLRVEIKVFDISIPVDPRRPNCDFKHRKLFAGSIEYFRLHHVCKISKTKNKATTKSSGVADFSNF